MRNSSATVQFLGGGRMATALCGGLLNSGWCTPEEVHVVEVDPAAVERLQTMWPGLTVGNYAVAAEGTVVAVKPGLVSEVLSGVSSKIDVGRVVSLAAGVDLATLEDCVAPGTPVVRTMPNTAALVGRAMTAIAAGRNATAGDIEWTEGLMRSVGTVMVVPERLMNAVTGVSGSGPAYVFLIAEALIDAGVLHGLSRDEARVLVTETIAGAGLLMAATGEEPTTLRANVTSPAGTTAAGLRAMESAGVRAAMIDAVSAAVDRAWELAR